MADEKKQDEVPKVRGFEIPNFDALGQWHTRLKNWCENAVGRIHELEIELGEARLTRDRYEEDVRSIRYDAEQHDILVEMLRDVGRGVRTLDEVMETIR